MHLVHFHYSPLFIITPCKNTTQLSTMENQDKLKELGLPGVNKSHCSKVAENLRVRQSTGLEIFDITPFLIREIKN